MSQPDVRATAARLLVPVLDGQGSLGHLDGGLAAAGIANRDRGFAKALCYGVCRALPRLEALSGELADGNLFHTVEVLSAETATPSSAIDSRPPMKAPVSSQRVLAQAMASRMGVCPK